MSPEEAVRRCEFWTTTASYALGSTGDPEVGRYLNGEEFDYERWSSGRNGRKGWAVLIPRWAGSEGNKIESALYHMIVREIARRGQE